jgi:hypothetical protein
LSLLAAKRLLAQVVQVECVDNAAHLEAKLRVLVVAVEAVGTGDEHFK